MYNGLKYTLTFLGGATIGAVVAWKLLKEKYERIAQEEINSVKEAYSELSDGYDGPNDSDEAAELAKAAKEKPDIRDYAAKIQREGYTDYSNITAGEQKKEEVAAVSVPRVISPEEFEELANDYDVINLTFYADEVLADDLDEPMDDIEGTVGVESLNQFGEYPEDPDTVYVWNDRLKVVYEICKDTKSYSEAIGLLDND